MSYEIYVEGGGDQDRLLRKCRAAFSRLFEKAGLAGKMPKVRACGSRRSACDWKSCPLLLVDSESPVKPSATAWQHLERDSGDGWKRPNGATDDQAHLMVQVMESWFLADRAALKKYFGVEFNEKSLPGRAEEIESIPKADVFKGLKDATAHCETKRQYAKGPHSFDILKSLDPQKIIAASPNAKRLFDKLME
jgi:hypothetical protein